MKTLSNQLWFDAINVQDSSDRFQINAESELSAKTILLDKLGYYLSKTGEHFSLFDADSKENLGTTGKVTIEQAMDAVLKLAKWKIQEPTILIGGETNLNDDADFVA